MRKMASLFSNFLLSIVLSFFIFLVSGGFIPFLFFAAIVHRFFSSLAPLSHIFSSSLLCLHFLSFISSITFSSFPFLLYFFHHHIFFFIFLLFLQFFCLMPYTFSGSSLTKSILSCLQFIHQFYI